MHILMTTALVASLLIVDSFLAASTWPGISRRTLDRLWTYAASTVAATIFLGAVYAVDLTFGAR